MNDRFTGNMLEPLTFDTHAAASRFIRKHVCSMCRGHLVGRHAENRRWAICCPECEAPAYEHNVTTPYTIEAIQAKEHETEIINRERRQVDPDAILKGLGF